jgi:CHAT domain-containing protein/Tfp pilus assembly protein PilF
MSSTNESDSAAIERLQAELDALMSQRDYPQAISVLERMLAILEQGDDPSVADIAGCHNNIAWLYEQLWDWESADKHYRAMLEAADRSGTTDGALLSQALDAIAGFLRRRGRFAEAEAEYKRLQQVLSQNGMDGSEAEVACLNELAMVIKSQGRASEAEPVYRRVLELTERLAGPTAPDTGSAHGNLALTYLSLARFSDSARHLDSMDRIFQANFPPEHPAHALQYTYRAMLHSEEGRLVDAESLDRRALAIREAALGPDDRWTLTSVHNLGVDRLRMGWLEDAKPLLRRAVEGRTQRLGASHPDTLTSANSLAAVLEGLRETAEAEALYSKALEGREASLGLTHPDTLTSLNNLAAFLEAEGRFAEAEALYSRAITDARTMIPKSPRLASLLNNYGLLLAANGQFESAAEHFDSALAIQRESLGPGDSRTADTLSNQGVLFWAWNKPANALEALRGANEIYERTLSLLMDSGAERQKSASAGFARVALHVAITLHMRVLPDDSESRRLAARLVLQRKGRLLDAVVSPLEALRRNSGPEENKLLAELRKIRTQRAVIFFDSPSEGGEASRVRLLRELEEREENIETAIGDLGRQLKARSRSVSIDDVCSALPADTALIEFARYPPFQPGFHRAQNRWDAPRYAAYLFKAGGTVEHADLGEAAAIEDLVRQLLDSLAHPGLSDYRPAARDIFKRILGPFSRDLQTIKHLIVSPDGLLNLLPFAVLIGADNRYLVDNMTISYVSTGRDLTHSRLSQPSVDPPTILADPDYGASTQGELQVRYPRLEYTAQEAESVRELLPKARVLADKNASKENLSGVRSPILLHLATHGEVKSDPNDPAPPAGPGSRSTEPENPLLRCWLALAGANDGQSSGVITGLELAGIDLLGTELVVASAWKSGLGKVQDGEGVYGLRRAFFLAGARSLLISLWNVSDEGTFEFMKRFYSRLLEGKSGAAAVCEVQRELLRSLDLRHPFFWSSFVFFGDFEPTELLGSATN